MAVQNQEIDSPLLKKHQITVVVKREDELHPIISGNKFRKLKYNLIEAKKQGHTTLLTYGGAFSNHILATAAAANEDGFKSIGVIRGEELKTKWRQNPTLSKAASLGMQFHFVTRNDYRKKHHREFKDDLKYRFGAFYELPEGGTNTLAVKGCEEILTKTDKNFDVICCSVGTGGTLAGIINASRPEQTILGFSALKGNFLEEEIKSMTEKKNWKLITDYHFGGYAKINSELVHFINQFLVDFSIPLDPIYTGKLFYGLFDLIKNGYFRPQIKVLVIHTGGLQGIKGMNAVLKSKNLPLLSV